MILGLILGLGIPIAAGVPTTIGVAEGVSHQRKQNESVKDDEKRMAKFQVEVYCEGGGGGGEEEKSTGKSNGRGKGKGKGEREVHGRRLGLRDGKVYVSTPTAPPAHPVTAFYIAYPDPDRPPTLGLVSTISDDPPLLNWIYVDRETLELKFGNRTQSREHLVGPWDWTKDVEDEDGGEGEGDGDGLVFEGWEGFVLVEEEEGVWGVRFDRGDDGLKGVVGVKGKRVLRVSLERKMVEGG